VALTLEVFDRSGMMIAALSGWHDAELAEEQLWRAILDALPRPGSRLPTQQLAPA
jgi:putative heme degradation protein